MNEPEAISRTDEEGYPLADGACGLSGIVSLDGRSSNELAKKGLQSVANMPYRAGVTYNDKGEVIAADGSGELIVLDKDQWGQMLSEKHRKNIDGNGERLQVAMFEFLRNSQPIVVEETKRAIERCFQREGLKVLEWRDVPVNENGMCEDRLGHMPKYAQLFYMVDGVDKTKDARTLFTVGRRVNADIRHVTRRSLALDRITYSGLITPDELAGSNGHAMYFQDFQWLKTMVAIGHGRFATNVLAANPQPLDTAGHNGEINSIAANRKALLDLGRAARFFNKVLTNAGSDSVHFNDALSLLLANGVPLPEALFRLIPPAIKKVSRDDVRKFVEASKRAMGVLGMWEGPAAIMAMDSEYFAARKDRLGLRPMRWMKFKEEGLGSVMALSSEFGAFRTKFSEIEKTGQLGAGEGMAIRFADGQLLQGDALFDHVLENTGINWEELSSSQLIVPMSCADYEGKKGVVNLKVKEVKAKPELYQKLAAFGWGFSTLQSVAERISSAKHITSSMGFPGPLASLDSKLSNIYDLYLARAAIVTNPPFDPKGEPDVIEQDVRLGNMPHMSPVEKFYSPIHKQYQLNSPIVPLKVLDEMKKGGKGKPKTKVFDATFTGANYDDFSKAMQMIVDEAVELAHSNKCDRPGIIVISDSEAFEGEPLKVPIPPVLLVQMINTKLVNEGVERNVSIVVESGGVRSAHDMAVLIASGAAAVCPSLMDAVANQADDAAQALKNLYKTEGEQLVKILSKLGITTIDGARMGYFFSAIGLAPELVKMGGGKIVSTLGGLDMRGVFDYLVMPQLDRYANVDTWMSSTNERSEKEDGAYSRELRELYNLAAFPNVKDLKKILKETEFLQLYDGTDLSSEELSNIAMQAGVKRREAKLLTLRDILDIKYATEEITPEMMENAPSPEQIFEHIFQAHMSLGAHGPVAHAAMVRGCKKVGVQSANGEGGEERERSRDGKRSEDRSESRQIGTAGWGVDLQYLMEADEICIKIAQGAKGGEGGDLPGEKVNQYVADLRYVKVGTRLISPPPNHDIYSIEDLKARIMALRALNPRARISIKVASMPGLGSIAEGIVKAGADVIEISGYDGGTGAADEESIEHCGYPVEAGLAEVHQYLVDAGVRDRVQLRADGKMMTPKDFVKMLLMGADGIGMGTLLMIFVKCIACQSCHTNKCPTGITTQDWDRIVKLFVKGERPDTGADETFERAFELMVATGAAGVEKGLRAFAAEVQKELVKLGVTKDNFEEMIGRVDKLEQRVTGNPIIDSLDLEQELLRRVQPPAWKSPNATRYDVRKRVRSVYINKMGDKVIANAEPFLDGQMKQLELHYEIENTDREFGVGLAGQVYERLMRGKKLTSEDLLTLRTRGVGGHNYAFAAGDGLKFVHEGFMNDSCGQYMSGTAKIVIKVPKDMQEQEGHALLGNQACMCATGGTLYCAGVAGERLGVRNSGATIVAEGALDYPFEYMTRGRGILLGDFVGMIGSRMTGGDIFIYDPDGDRRGRVAKEYVHVAEMNDEKFDVLRAEIQAFYEETGSLQASRILADWDSEKFKFAMIVPNEA